MKNLITKRGKLLRLGGIVLALLIAGLYIGLPTIMAVGVILPDTDNTGEPPEDFTNITLTARDDVQLAAWYAEPENGAVIILLHGAGNEREDVREHAIMLHENGFGVLAMNLRGHGDSEGRINRLGWDGSMDVGAAVDYLSGRDNIDFIGALGLSMGGEILLGAASQYPIIRAIAADGATFRAVDDYVSLPSNRALYRNMVTGIFTFMVSVFTGDGQPAPTLLNSIKATDTTFFLFIAAGNVGEEIDYNEMFHNAVVDRSELWIIPNVRHTQGFAQNRTEYERRLINFFTTAMRDL